MPILCWDSCVVIDAVCRAKDWWPQIMPMYDKALVGECMILVSEITVAEACKPTSTYKPQAEIVADIEAFFLNPFILRRPVDDRVSALAARIIREHNAGTCDALIIATACVFGANTLYTRDGHRDNKKKRTKMLAMSKKCRYRDTDPMLVIEPPDAATFLNWPLFKKDAP